MQSCPFPFTYAMGAVWIGHELELLIVFYHLIQKHFTIVVMNIVIPRAVNVEQITPEILYIGYGRAVDKILPVLLR